MKKIIYIIFLSIFMAGCSFLSAPNTSIMGIHPDTKIDVDVPNGVNSSDIDLTGRESHNTVFGDKIVGSRIPSIAAQFQYQLQSNDVRPPRVVGSGSFDQEESMLNMYTGNDSNGSIIIESQSYLRYLPGHEVQVLFTSVFSNNVNIIQRAGVFDDSNGFFLEWDGVFLDSCRRRASVDFCEPINLTGIFNGVDLDPTNGNVYSISYGYLGFAPISFSVMTPEGGWVLINKIKYPNTESVTHITQTFLPMRAETINVGQITDTVLSIGSIWGGIVDGNIVPGSSRDPTARFFTQESPVVSSTDGVLFAFRSKDTYENIDNRISSLLKLVSCSTDGIKPVRFKLLKNPEFLSATWNNVSVDSVLEYSTDLVLNVSAEDGESFLYWDMAKSDSFFEDVENQNLLLPPNGVAVFYFESQVSNEVQCSIRWAELF
jgi:hypothetical protein